MGIFTRFADIVSSNLNAMLDRAEDPEKMIKMMIREMEDTLVELKSSCAGVIAERKKLMRRADEMSGRRDLWAERADLAVARGRDDLAREALLEKRRFAELAEALQTEIADHSDLVDQYHNDIRELEQKLATAKEKKRMLIQRHRQASGRKRAQNGIRRMDSAETMHRFEDLERRIDNMEAEADLVNFGRQPTLDEEFDNLATDDEIERELAALKAARKSAQ
ncbi:MAG: phage shock protein PspA [Desulfopila sp.]